MVKLSRCTCGDLKVRHADGGEGYCRDCHFCLAFKAEEEMEFAPDPDCKKCGGEGWTVWYGPTPEREPCECIELREVSDA